MQQNSAWFKQPLIRELIAVLLLKLALLSGLWWAFFSEPHTPSNEQSVSRALLGTSTPTSTQINIQTTGENNP